MYEGYNSNLNDTMKKKVSQRWYVGHSTGQMTWFLKARRRTEGGGSVIEKNLRDTQPNTVCERRFRS